MSPCRLIPCPPPQLPWRAEPLFETTPPGPARTGVWGPSAAVLGYPRPPAVGVGQEQTRSRGTTVARARLGTYGGGARAPTPRVGGVSRVRPARERACACPAADWPARGLRVRARCQGRTVGSRSAWCLWGWCARAADSPDWPAVGGGGVGATLPGNCGRRAGRRLRSAAPPGLSPCPSPSSPRWNLEWALSPPGGRACPAGPVFVGEINTMTGRKISALRPRK